MHWWKLQNTSLVPDQSHVHSEMLSRDGLQVSSSLLAMASASGYPFLRQQGRSFLHSFGHMAARSGYTPLLGQGLGGLESVKLPQA